MEFHRRRAMAPPLVFMREIGHAGLGADRIRASPNLAAVDQCNANGR
jgi:hypothetical protein